MAKWILKAVVQKAISFLPFRERINFFFQKYVTKGVFLDDEHFGYKLVAARDHLRFYGKYGTVPLREARILELGTGWYPIVPTLLWLAGAERTVSVDISDWMNPSRMRTAFSRILEYYDNGKLTAYLAHPDPEKIALLRQVCADPQPEERASLCRLIGLEARIMDATQLDFPDAHFDFICSNNTFEHVHEPVLAAILREFKRVRKPDGVMSHFVDLSDHFAHMDGSINIYHFLRFGKRDWQRIDNDIQPQNRLRWKDYRALYAGAGLGIREEEFRAGSVALLRQVDVHPEFAAYTEEELAISHGYFIS